MKYFLEMYLSSFCVLDENQRAKCECRKGYAPFGSNGCADIDECSNGQNNCSNNADCINKNGHFDCRCQPGFIGDGINCEREITCSDLNCDSNAQCLMEGPNQAKCVCNQGFKGDGFTCQPMPTYLSFSGSSLEDEIIFDPSIYPAVINSVNDLGPKIEHTYMVENRGPQTARQLKIKISLPLKDTNDRNLTYFQEEPLVNIHAMSGGSNIQSCTSEKPNSINPRRLKRQGIVHYKNCLLTT